MGRTRLLAGILAVSIAGPSPLRAAQASEVPVAPSGGVSVVTHLSAVPPQLAPMPLVVPILAAPALLTYQPQQVQPVPYADAGAFFLPPAAVTTVPQRPPDSSGPEASLGLHGKGFYRAPRSPDESGVWFDQGRLKTAAETAVPVVAQKGSAVPAETILAEAFPGELTEIEKLLPAEFRERSGRTLRARFNEAAQSRRVEVGRELLERYDAALPPAEKLDYGSPRALRESLEWSSLLHRVGAGRAFPFRFGPKAREAATAVLQALLAERPEFGTKAYQRVARTIGVMVMKDGTVYVAFSGDPVTLRVMMGGYEKALEDRLNAGGRYRYRVLPADTPVPEGMEAVDERGTGNFCAEKKLLSVLREGVVSISEVDEWAVRWRGPPGKTIYSTHSYREFMQPCEHCIRNAKVMLGAEHRSALK